MKGAVRTMYAFSVYLFVVGVFLAIGPNTLLALVGLPETNEVWIRILGIVSLLLALYYFDAARDNSRSFFAASILGRGFSKAALVVFWATGHPWQLLIFASVEWAGAIWTYTAMSFQAQG